MCAGVRCSQSLLFGLPLAKWVSSELSCMGVWVSNEASGLNASGIQRPTGKNIPETKRASDAH
jgi:hypothetical protein